MKPAAKSKPLHSPNTNSQTFTYSLPKSEPDLDADPWDQNYSYATPEGTGVQMKLPADTNSVSAQPSGKRTLFLDTKYCIFQIWSIFVQAVLRNRQIIPVYALPSNLSPSPSSETFLYEVSARVPGAVTCICLICLVIPFRPATCPITY